MSNQGNDSSQQFRYRKSIENVIGKRTGTFIRKSNIGTDYDGLKNVDDFFDNNTDKLSIANTDDFDTSVASDVWIDASDTEGPSPGGSSVRKREKMKEKRKKRWTEASSQNSFGFFDEMLQSITNQQEEKNDKKETLAAIPDLSSAKAPNPKRKANNNLPIAFRTQEDAQSSTNVSPARDNTDHFDNNEMTNMTAMTHLTRTPSISRSSIDEGSASKSASALKNLSIMKQQKQNFSEYLQNDQRNKELEMKRKQLRQMQESNSQEISIFKSPISNDYMSPNRAFNLNLTTFSMLDSTSKKAAFGAHHNASIEIATYNDNAQTYQSFVDHHQDSRVERKINLFEEDNRAQLKKPPSSKNADYDREPEKQDKDKDKKKNNKEKEKEKKDRVEAKENIKEDSNSNPNPKKVVKGTTKNSSKNAVIEEEKEVVSKDKQGGKNNKASEMRDITNNNKFEAKNSKTTAANAAPAEEKKTSFEIKPLTKSKNDDKKATINKYTNKEPEEEEKENMAPPAPKVVQKNKKSDKEKEKEKEKDKENNNGTKSTTRMIEEEKKITKTKEAGTKLRDITNSQDKEVRMTSPGGFDRFQDSIDVGDHYFDMDHDVGPSIHNDYDYKAYEQHYGTSHYENESRSKTIERGGEKDKKSKDNKQEEEKNKKVVQITKKDKEKEKEKEKDVEAPKLKKVKKTKDVEDQAQEKTKKIKMPPKASKEKREKKEKDPLKEKKEPVRRNKRKRDAFLENYDRIIGPNDLHLIEQAVPVIRGSFANGRYPKRHRMPTFCFWKNERPIYKDMGNGREMVGLLVEENHPMPLNAFDTSMEILTQEPKPSKKLAKMNKRASFTDEKQFKKIRNTYQDSSEEEEEEEEENNHHYKLQTLDKMELDYKIVSEDKDSIKVFLKLKPKQHKETQINIAGPMRCSVIKCEDRKVEVTCDSKQFILSLNDKFTIPARAAYSIQNKSKNKELELTCNIEKH